MIHGIIENIKCRMVAEGIGQDSIIKVSDIIESELCKYELKPKETAIVLHDKTDIEIFQRFLFSKVASGLSERTIKYYTFALKRFFFKIGKHIKDISADDIRLYLSYLRAGGVTNVSIDNERRVISSFFAWACLEDIIVKNPSLRVSKVKAKKIVKKALTEDELEMLRAAAQTDRDKAILETLYSTGCRVSELVAIDKQDVDFDNREVIVTGKGNKERKVFLSARCIAALKSYLTKREDKNPALFVTQYERLRGIGLSRGINRLKQSGVEVMIRNLGKKAGIDNVHPHRIRRTSATLALRRGMPIEQVSKMLGHEDLKTTTIYATSTVDDVKLSHSKYI